MKKLIVNGSLIFAAVAVVTAAVVLANVYLTRVAVAPSEAACTKQGHSHTVTISNDQLSTVDTVAKLCDTLTILNEDKRIRLIAFGDHDKHQAYDGVTEQVLAENQSLTVALNKLGTYTFHDHNNDEVAGTFTVSK